VAGLSLALILGHNLLDGVKPDSLGAMGGLWHFLHVPGFAIPGILFIGYPLIPWVGVMGLGYALATLYQRDVAHRRKVLAWSGLAAIALFAVLRGMNGYGNSFPWTPQRTPALTVASFLNVAKYPPSLDFLAMTLGPIMLALAWTERARGRVADWLSVYGRVPLFFYVTHIFVAHVVAVLIALVQGRTVMRIPVLTGLGSLPEWYGLSLPGVYVAWAVVVILLYHPCRAFARLKDTRTAWWLRYL
jgi:uncharacterized membrane protein